MKGLAIILGLVFVLIVVLGALPAKIGRESFTSTGTIIQLATSHVPTAEDLRSRECMGGLYGCAYRWIPFGFTA